MISGVMANPIKCRVCGAASPIVLRRSTLNGLMCAGIQCPNNHNYDIEWKELTAAIDNVHEYLQSPEQTVTDVLKRKNIRVCFGKMGWRIRRNQEVKTQYYLPDAEDVASAFEYIVNDAINNADRHAIELSQCAVCLLFDRCKVMSGLTEDD